jgi:molybdenum cofactor synthesis domain-containing protein
MSGSAEILVVGSEVLNGDVLDSNSYWLCRQLAGEGWRVRRVTVVPDEPESIASALKDSLARRPDLVVTSGGLGPTADDLTLGAVAAALDLEQRRHPEAYAMVRDFYTRLHARGDVDSAEITEARAKMADLPAAAEPLLNAVGAAPGVWLQVGGTVVCCLPGVPAELKSIYTNALWPRVVSGKEAGFRLARIVTTDCWDESLLAPLVDGVAARHPRVYVKSRAQAYGRGIAAFVTLSTDGASPEAAGALLAPALKDLLGALLAKGITATVADQAPVPPGGMAG